MLKAINKLNIILSLMLLLIAISFFLYAQNNNFQNNQKIERNGSNNISEICFENKCFNVEIADTSEKRRTGLMNRESLAIDSGMLFTFEKEGIYNSWMKNTLIPLDIIWFNKDNEIIFIKENAQPCKTEQCETFGPEKKAKYILEINGGLAEKTGVEIGDEIEFR